MKFFGKKITPLSVLRGVLSSKFFPFVTAAVVMACYYTGMEIITFYYMAAVGILMLVFLDDLTPIISLFLFMNVMVSRQNSPSVLLGGSDYYSGTAVKVQIFTLISVFVLAIFARIIFTGVKKQFKPTAIFYVLCAFAAALIMNGVMAEGYDIKNLAFGVFTAFMFLVIFALIKDNVKVDGKPFERIAWGFIALGILLIIELIVGYATFEGLITDGKVNRAKLTFGWGFYNTMGTLLIFCVPSATYLAGKYKYGFPFALFAYVLFIAAFFTLSRQAMLGAITIYPVCLIILLVKGKNMIPNLIVTAAAVIATIICVGLYDDVVLKYLGDLFKALFDDDGELNGSGRMEIYKIALDNYKSAPVFGTGFFADIPPAANFVGLDIIPARYHNTIMQVLAACGTFGIVTYGIHRIQTFVCYFKNVTMDRTFVALTVLSLLIISLVDNHMFNLLPTLVYSCLIGVLVKSQQKTA